MTGQALTPAVVDGFGGLRLDLDPEEVGLGQSIDGLDAHTAGGRLRQRDGTTTFITKTSDTALWMALSPAAVLVCWNATVIAYDRGVGAVIASVAVVNPYDPVIIGTPATVRGYFLEFGVSLRKWNGTAFSSVAFTGDPYALTTSPVSNRLVVAAAQAGGINPDTLYFSDAGDPESFPVNNYVELDPGDTEVIWDLVTWRDQVFAFKQSKFYVFYGESTDGTGKPIFNYRPVRVARGALWPTQTKGLACAGPDGVYFVSTDGIYRTTGADPVKVSGPLDAWFDGTLPATATALANTSLAGGSTVQISSDGTRYVYFRVTPTVGDKRTAVYDTEQGTWSIWSIPIYSAMTLSSERLLGTNGKIMKSSSRTTTDDGTAITWSYRTGLSDLGIPEQKVLRQTQVWGSGSPTVSVYTDHNTTDPGASALELGTAPAVLSKTQRYSRKGTFFSLGLSGAGPVSINRAAFEIRDRRLAGMA